MWACPALRLTVSKSWFITWLFWAQLKCQDGTVVLGMNGQCIPYMVPRNFNPLRCTTEAHVWRFNSQGLVFVFSEDLVIRLQSKPCREHKTDVSVFYVTEIGRNQAPQRRCLDLLVKEIFVHNSWNVEQGISHPKECVFTAERQKHIVLCRLPLTRLCRNREHTKICCDTENHLFPIVWH